MSSAPEMTPNLAQDIIAIGKIEAVENILRVVCHATGLGFSAVARVTDSQWIACAVRDEIGFGLQPGGELDLKTTFCDIVRESGRVVVIDHVAEDETFRDHPIPKLYGFQSYISVPIHLPDGRFFGTLCAIGPNPAKVNNPETIGMLNLFAELIAFHLDAQDHVENIESALSGEREKAQLREQFIAVLGHDLRNPIGAINAGADVLRLLPQTEEAYPILDVIQRSTTRMAELINNVVDLARCRLGGFNVSRSLDPRLGATLDHVVAELKTAWPERTIECKFHLDGAISCDSSRLGQMLSNLLANALTHGERDSPVWVRAEAGADRFELSVANRGEQIAPHIVEQLFEPFSRGNAKPGEAGLGLGLYIASEIAKAHDGELCVTSHDGLTRFTFSMPLVGNAASAAAMP